MIKPSGSASNRRSTAGEFGKVRRHYDQLGLGDKTAIAWFNGGHVIHGAQTYEFLHRHLHWPQR